MNIRETLEELLTKRIWITSDFQRMKKYLPLLMNLYVAARRAVETGDPGVMQGILDKLEPPLKKDPVKAIEAAVEAGAIEVDRDEA